MIYRLETLYHLRHHQALHERLNNVNLNLSTIFREKQRLNIIIKDLLLISLPHQPQALTKQGKPCLADIATKLAITDQFHI